MVWNSYLESMKTKNDLRTVEKFTEGLKSCKILQFPGAGENTVFSGTRPYYNSTVPYTTIVNGRPGVDLPEYIPDFRPHLQRDGLILLSWDKRICERGFLYTAYWVTSSGIHRYYASNACMLEDFAESMPYRKSYAAEDGIDYYGEAGPMYIVHVAPELMMNSCQKKVQRPEHIRKLVALGSKVDFNYNFLLTRERKRFFFNDGPNPKGA